MLIDTSAEALTVVVTVVLVLLAVFGSGVLGELTVALLVMVPPSAGAVMLMVMVEGVPTVIGVLLVQLTVISCGAFGSVAVEQFQPVPVALTALTPWGKVSLTLMGLVAEAAAVEGPLLTTVRL